MLDMVLPHQTYKIYKNKNMKTKTKFQLIKKKKIKAPIKIMLHLSYHFGEMSKLCMPPRRERSWGLKYENKTAMTQRYVSCAFHGLIS